MGLKMAFCLLGLTLPARRAHIGSVGACSSAFLGRFSPYQAGIAAISPLIPTKATMRFML